MRGVFEATPEPLQESHSHRGDAADWLEVVSDQLSGLSSLLEKRDGRRQVTWIEKGAGKDGRLFRPARRDNVVRSLEECLQFLASLQSRLKNEGDLKPIIERLEIAIHNLKNIEFLGMSTRPAA